MIHFLTHITIIVMTVEKKGKRNFRGTLIGERTVFKDYH